LMCKFARTVSIVFVREVILPQNQGD